MIFRRSILFGTYYIFGLSLCILQHCAEISHAEQTNERREEEEPVTGGNQPPCSLCQGLSIAADDIPFPSESDETCGVFDAYFQSPDFHSRGVVASVTNLPPNATINSPGGCRADTEFNMAFESCCDRSVPLWQCEQNIHEFLFENGYNAGVPPIEGRNEPLNISVFMQYEAIENIDVEQGTLTVFLQTILKWKDPRLAWDVNDFTTCANVIDVWTGHEQGDSPIWLPDFDVTNQIEGHQSMASYKANVFSDGTVHWSLHGGVTAFCAYTGLAMIPFDTLGCQVLFAPSTRDFSGLINYVLEYPEYFFHGAFDVTYNEFTPVPELGKIGYAFDKRAIYINLYFKRATTTYVQNIVIPTVILTYLSFFTFLLDMRVGERLGFGMALALVVVAQQIVTSDMTPISDQKLWLDKFVAWSFYWVLVGVVESVLIGFLYYVREDRKECTEEKEGSTSITATLEEQQAMLPRTSDTKKRDITNTGEVGSSEVMESGELDSNTENLTSLVSKECKLAVNTASSASMHWFYTVNLRRLDLVFLLVTVATYTIFIAWMFSISRTTTWLTDEPVWFNNTMDFSLNFNANLMNNTGH